MKKALIIVLAIVFVLSIAAIKPDLTQVTIKNKSDQVASVLLLDPATLSELFYFSVNPLETKSFELPRGDYLLQATFCGETALANDFKLQGRHQFTIPKCGKNPPIQEDGASKFIRSPRYVNPE